MKTLEQEVQYLVDAGLDNAAIAKFLECSKRSVRRYANPYREMKEGTARLDDGPRILLFDIETSPCEFYGWQLKQYGYVPHYMVRKSWAILCWSAKWLFDDTIMHGCVDPEEAYGRTDKSIIHELWHLMDKAEILIAHNGDQFDIKKANTRFKMNGLGPPMPYRSIDTLKKLRQKFSLDSYKLDYVNQLFGLNTKKGNEEGFQLWKKCVEPSMGMQQESLNQMLSYCDNDVMILEELYVQIRAWIKGHPNMGLYLTGDNINKCTNCGSGDLDWRGKYYTPAGRYRAFRCRSCSAVGRSKSVDLSKEEKEETICRTVA